MITNSKEQNSWESFEILSQSARCKTEMSYPGMRTLDEALAVLLLLEFSRSLVDRRPLCPLKNDQESLIYFENNVLAGHTAGTLHISTNLLKVQKAGFFALKSKVVALQVNYPAGLFLAAS